MIGTKNPEKESLLLTKFDIEMIKTRQDAVIYLAESGRIDLDMFFDLYEKQLTPEVIREERKAYLQILSPTADDEAFHNSPLSRLYGLISTIKPNANTLPEVSEPSVN